MGRAHDARSSLPFAAAVAADGNDDAHRLAIPSSFSANSAAFPV